MSGLRPTQTPLPSAGADAGRSDGRDGPRIAYLTGEYPRATDTFIQREVAALRDIGLQVQTCSIRRTGAEHIVGPEQEAEQAQTFHVLAGLTSLSGIAAQFRALKRPGAWAPALALAWRTAPKGVKGRLYNLIYFAEAVVLAEHLRATRVTHLHNHIAKASCTVAMLTSKLAGIPYSFTLHGPDIFFEPYHWRLDVKISRATFVACISRFCRSQAMLFSDPADWDKLHVVHCGIKPARYADAPPPAARGNLLFVGRLGAVKGVPILLDAFRRARNANPGLTLTLIGDGPDRRALEAAAADLGGAVRFLGYRNQAQVADALAVCDALVLPSFAEGVPVVLMEAMAAGRPVVATQVGGIGELVQDGISGRLVPPGDPEALAGAIHDVLDNGPAMGTAGRETVTVHFDAAREAARLAILFYAGTTGIRPAIRPGDTAKDPS